MSSTFPALTSALCRHDEAANDYLSCSGGTGSTAPTLLVQDMEERLSALEAMNHALRLEAEKSAEQVQFRLAEVEHRLMNIFATIQALAAQTARPGDTGEAFRVTFGARLLALARSHELLGSRYPDGAPLAEVVGRCLQPYEGAADRITVLGPAVHLPARDVPPLGLAIHELTTNAAKYGALSIPEGRVEVTWQLEARRKDQLPAVVIIWRERGGPRVNTPTRRGFGSKLLESGLAQGSGGTAQLDFAPLGVDCRIWLPLLATGVSPAL